MRTCSCSTQRADLPSAGFGLRRGEALLLLRRKEGEAKIGYQVVAIVDAVGLGVVVVVAAGNELAMKCELSPESAEKMCKRLEL